MGNIFLLITCLVSGFIIRNHFRFFDAKNIEVLNQMIIYFFVPAISLYYIPKITFEYSLIWLSITPFIVFGLSFVFFQLTDRFYHFQPDTKSALILTSGISSTSFVGFPIFEMLYGEIGLTYGIFLSLGGTILVFNTVGIFSLLFFSGDKKSPYDIIKRVFTFFPFIIFLISIVLNLTGIDLPEIVNMSLGKIAGAFSVIALITIGMQLDFNISARLFSELSIGLFFKLIIAPICIYLLIWHVIDLRNLVGRICILGACIGSMNAMSVITAQRGLNPKLSVLMSAIGIPLSIPILFAIHYLL